MTAREAVEKTKEMWAWLAETGRDKADYFATIGIPVKEIPINGCWLCQSAVRGCYDCPLFGLWVEDGRGIETCEAFKSPYEMWASAKTPKTMKRCAAQIVNLCDKWLEENK